MPLEASKGDKCICATHSECFHFIWLICRREPSSCGSSACPGVLCLPACKIAALVRCSQLICLTVLPSSLSVSQLHNLPHASCRQKVSNIFLWSLRRKLHARSQCICHLLLLWDCFAMCCCYVCNFLRFLFSVCLFCAVLLLQCRSCAVKHCHLMLAAAPVLVFPHAFTILTQPGCVILGGSGPALGPPTVCQSVFPTDMIGWTTRVDNLSSMCWRMPCHFWNTLCDLMFYFSLEAGAFTPMVVFAFLHLLSFPVGHMMGCDGISPVWKWRNTFYYVWYQWCERKG